MSELVTDLVHTMAKQLEQRAKVPAADIWPCDKADITKTFDYSGAPLLDILYQVFSQAKNIEELAPCFVRPARLAYLAYLFTTKPKDEKDSDRRVFVAEKMVECVSWLRNGNPFLKNNKNNNNIIFRTDCSGSIKEFDDLEFIDNFSKETERLARCVFAALSTLIEHTFFAWMGAGREYHGLYNYKGMKIFVRDYYDLIVPHWQFSKELPWKSLQFVTVEDENASVHFDFNGRGNVIRGNMRKIALRVDNNPIPHNKFESEIKEIFKVLQIALSNAIEESNKMTGEQLLLQFIRSQYYIVQTVCDNAQIPIDVKVSKDVEEGILNSKNIPSGFEHTKQRLIATDNVNLRYRLLVDYLDPGNLHKL